MSQESSDIHSEHPRADSRWRVLRTIRASDAGCSVQFLAEDSGLHPNTIRFHLDRLEADGLIHRQTRHEGEHGRPPLIYTAAAVPDAGSEHRNFGQLAKVLAQLVAEKNSDPVGAAVESGRIWGHEIVSGSAPASSQEEAVAALVETLTQLDFAPKLSDDSEDKIVLQRHCPFLEIAQTHQEVVCSVHLGLMRGILEEVEAPVVAERLVPFAGPSGCAAYLGRPTKPVSTSA